MSERDRAALRHIEATYQLLDGWRARSRSPERPEQGSELEADAQVWTWHPPYEVARQSLIAAVQHLNLARTAIEAHEVYPTSHFTVLRGALVGAAQGVWLLAPDDASERQQRALRVIDEWYRRREQYNNSVASADLSDVDRTRLHDQTGHLQERRCQARRLWARTDTLGADERLNLTRVITWAGADTFTGPRAAVGRATLVEPDEWRRTCTRMVTDSPRARLDQGPRWLGRGDCTRRSPRHRSAVRCLLSASEKRVEPIRSACGRERLNRERCRWPIGKRSQGRHRTSRPPS
jgi:hypothetical protein